MFDFAWSELMVIGAVALIVIGPKDLPRALKTAGMVVRRARALAREFQGSIEDLIREAELEDVRRSVHQATSLDINRTIERTLDPERRLPRHIGPFELEPDPARPAEVEETQPVSAQAAVALQAEPRPGRDASDQIHPTTHPPEP
jgi:sec-independent protein translocase protein TatB